MQPTKSDIITVTGPGFVGEIAAGSGISTLLVTGTSFSISNILPLIETLNKQRSFSGRKQINIQGYQINLDDNVNIPEVAIRVVCRILELHKDVVIDTSGIDYARSFPRARNGQAAGESGENGVDGGNGGSAGNIVLYAGKITGDGKLILKSDGGSGGAGQNGGSGIKGERGRQAGDRRRNKKLREQDEGKGDRGGKGATGGGAGNGGDGGRAGDGGRIFIMRPLANASSITASSVKGRPGSAGSAGKPGAGGDGGAGGRDIKCYPNDRPFMLRAASDDPNISLFDIYSFVSLNEEAYQQRVSEKPIGEQLAISQDSSLQSTFLRNRHICSYQKTRGPSGSPGDPGQNGLSGSTGVQGRNGAIKFENSNFDKLPDGVAFLLRVSFIRMLLHTIELDYLNNSRQECVIKLLWLKEYLEDDKSANPRTYEAIDFEVDSAKLYSPAFVQATHKRVQILLQQLSQGLDRYGNEPGYVPLVSARFYETTLDSILSLASSIEADSNQFIDKKSSNDEKRSSIIKTADNLEIKSFSIANEASQVTTELDSLRAQIGLLLNELIQYRTQLQDSENAFRDAVSRQAACGFEEVLTVAAAVVAIYSGGASVVAGIAGLANTDQKIRDDAKTAEKKVSTIETKSKYISGQYAVIGKGLNNIKEGYLSVKSLLEEDADGAKLLVSEEDFEEVLKPFLDDLPEAREFRDVMRQYLRIAKIRNQMILSADIKATRLLDLEIDLEENNIEIATTQDRLSRVYNPLLSEHIAFFQRALPNIKSSILRAIYMEHKALEYWSLSPSLLPNNLQDLSIAQLKVYHLSFKDSYLQKVEEKNGAPQELEGPTILLSRQVMPKIFDTLGRSGALTFNLSPDIPAYRFYSQVLASQLDVSFKFNEGINDDMQFTLFHNGDPVLVDRLGKKHYFKHRPRYITQRLKQGSTSVSMGLGGFEGRYSFLSPFASWTILIALVNEDNVDTVMQERSKIEEISLTFRGTAFARYTTDPTLLLPVSTASSVWTYVP